jgi:hypothetical protein
VKVEVSRHSLDSSRNGLATMVADYSHNSLLYSLSGLNRAIPFRDPDLSGGLIWFTQCCSQTFTCSEQAFEGDSKQAP